MSVAQPQANLRLWWVASYYDGHTIYESEQAGKVSSEEIDRHALKRFSLVNADGDEIFVVDFPEGDDPKLVYRRRSFAGQPALTDDGIPLVDADPDTPEWLVWEWTYIVGKHYSDGNLEIYGMNADGSFHSDPRALSCVTGHEEFRDEITWSTDHWGPTLALDLDLSIKELAMAVEGDHVTVRLPGEIVPPVFNEETGELETPEALRLFTSVSEVISAVNATGIITGVAEDSQDGLVRPAAREVVSDVVLVPCELF